MGACCSNHNLTEKRFKWATFATLIIFFAEFFGGWWTNSLALLSDAGHVFMDLFSLALSWGALKISTLPPSDRRTFGFHRIEIFTAFINGFSLLLISAIVFYEAWGRLYEPEPVKSIEMLLIAFIGLAVNILIALSLRGTDKNDLNLQSALYHVMGDALASVGVIVGGVIMYYTNSYIIDPIVSFMIGLIIVGGSVRIIRKSGHILLEGVPEGIKLEDVIKSISSVKGVEDVHGLHLWSICSNLYSLSAHVLVKDQNISSCKVILTEIHSILVEKHKITNNTIQFECQNCGESSLYKNLKH